jgi:hypothetical protein
MRPFGPMFARAPRPSHQGLVKNGPPGAGFGAVRPQIRAAHLADAVVPLLSQ